MKPLRRVALKRADYFGRSGRQLSSLTLATCAAGRFQALLPGRINARGRSRFDTCPLQCEPRHTIVAYGLLAWSWAWRPIELPRFDPQEPGRPQFCRALPHTAVWGNRGRFSAYAHRRIPISVGTANPARAEGPTYATPSGFLRFGRERTALKPPLSRAGK